MGDHRPADPRAGPQVRGAPRRRRPGRRPGHGHLRRAHLERDRDPLGARGGRPARAPAAARSAPAAVRAGRQARRGAGEHRHAPAERLPRPAHHRHRALPARAGRPAVRRAAQQHVRAAGAHRRQRPGPGDPGLRPPASRAPAPARDQRQLAVRGRPGLRPALRAHADVHQVLPALRRPGPVRDVGELAAVRGPAAAHELDRRVHPAVVVGARASLLRHDRGPDLRRADHRPRGRRAHPADRRAASRRRCGRSTRARSRRRSRAA